MSTSVTLLPNIGAEFRAPLGNGTIQFGDDRSAVCAVLGDPEPQVEEHRLTFADASVQVHLGRTGVEFIEFHTNPHSNGVEVELNGKNLSQLGVADCTEYLRDCNKLEAVDDSEAPAAWVFKGIGLTVWQPYAFEDAQEDLNHATQAGEIAPEELQYLRDEVARAAHFESIGIGSPEYMESYF